MLLDILESIVSSLVGIATKWLFSRQQSRAAAKAQAQRDAAEVGQSTNRDITDTAVQAAREQTDATLSQMGAQSGNDVANELQRDAAAANAAAQQADRDVRGA